MGWADQHSEETRELAYQVWAFEAGRKGKTARDILIREYTLEDGSPVDVPVRTINDWVTRYEWPERVARDLAAIAPDIRHQTIGELIMGALEGARTLRRSVQAPRYIRTEEGDIETDKHGNPVMEAKPDKTEVTAALGLLDRAGFSHIGQGRVQTVEAPSMLPADVDIAAMSIEEALTYQMGMLERMTSGVKQPS